MSQSEIHGALNDAFEELTVAMVQVQRIRRALEQPDQGLAAVYVDGTSTLISRIEQRLRTLRDLIGGRTPAAARLTPEDGQPFINFLERWGTLPTGEQCLSCPCCARVVGHRETCDHYVHAPLSYVVLRIDQGVRYYMPILLGPHDPKP